MVSVIIPVYQVSGYVERCIRSVMAQSYTDVECIIVDDATKDDSIEKCKRLIGAYDGPIQFQIIHHEQNRGLSAARNTGTNAAKGEYLFYLDSDDFITTNCIGTLVSVVRDDPSIEMVQGKFSKYANGKGWPQDGMERSIRISNNDEVRQEFFKNRNIYISVWNRLLKKSFVDEYRLYCREGLVFEDLLWIFYLVKHLNKAYICDEITYSYCIRQESILIGAKRDSVSCYVTSFNEILNNLTEGYERNEIEGFLYYFIRRYVSYVKTVPEFKDVIRLYRARARQFHCRKGFVVLFITGVLCRFGSPMGVLKWMNGLRWKLMRVRG